MANKQDLFNAIARSVSGYSILSEVAILQLYLNAPVHARPVLSSLILIQRV